MNRSANIVSAGLSIFPIISVGLVNSLSDWLILLFNIMSAPRVINTAKNENNNKLINRLKLPKFNSFLSLAYLEKSPKLNNTIAKYANIVPVTDIKVVMFELLKISSKEIRFEKLENNF